MLCLVGNVGCHSSYSLFLPLQKSTPGTNSSGSEGEDDEDEEDNDEMGDEGAVDEGEASGSEGVMIMDPPKVGITH